MSIRPNYAELEATKIPTAIDIAWAAGIYEGEGTCRLCGRGKRSFALAVVQKEPEILIRLRDWFGGNISLPSPGHKTSCHTWNACGDRARIFLALIYPFLSARRKLQADLTGALEFMAGLPTDGISMEELTSKLETFSQSQRSGSLRQNTNSINRRRYYARHREELALQRKIKRDGLQKNNVVSIDSTKVG